MSGERYYVAIVPDSLWSSPGSWSYTPAGPSGAPPPDSTCTAIFNAAGLGRCTADSSAPIGGLRIVTPFDGTVSLSANSMTVLDLGAVINCGRFRILSGNVYVQSTLSIGSAASISSSTDLGGIHVLGDATIGAVSMSSGALNVYGGSAVHFSGSQLWNLQVLDSSRGQYASFDGTATVSNNLYLSSGIMHRYSDQSAQVVRVGNDVHCQGAFGSWDARNNAVVMLNGAGDQTVFTGGILPSLTISRTASDPVVCDGTAQVQIAGDFLISDGTFNTNGLDLKVGT
jgi:hypothetical protein